MSRKETTLRRHFQQLRHTLEEAEKVYFEDGNIEAAQDDMYSLQELAKEIARRLNSTVV